MNKEYKENQKRNKPQTVSTVYITSTTFADVRSTTLNRSKVTAE